MSLDNLADMCPCPALALDKNAHVVFSNRAWRELADDSGELLRALRALPDSPEVELLTEELKWGQSWFKVTANLADPSCRFFVLTDISELKGREEAALRRSQYDPLTQTYNRAAFRAYVDGLPAASNTALLFVDLDRFKRVNDRYGHSVGDEVLRYTASRLRSLLKANDIIARWGGDEFVICLAQTTVAEANEVKKRLLNAFHEPYVVSGTRLRLSASIGVAVVNLSEVALKTALEQADTDMYLAKLSTEPRTFAKSYVEELSAHR